MNSEYSSSYDQTESRYRRSRSHRKKEKLQEAPDVREVIKQVPFKEHMRFLFLSILLSCFSIAVPFFTTVFSNSMQSQNLYTGFAMANGVLPYTNIFSTGGFFYYSLIALSYHFGSTLLLIPFMTFFFYLSGFYLYRIAINFSQSASIAKGVCLLFYFLNFVVGFGGLYPIQWAQPFFLMSFWYLMRYFNGATRDEVFIRYGFTMAIALLFEPRLLVFALFAFIALIVFNLRQKRFARGIYQFLCIVFGVILMGYIAGYFIWNLQLSIPYFKQTVINSFTFFTYGDSNIWLTAIFQLVILFAIGGVTVFGYGIKRLNVIAYRESRIILLFSLLFYGLTMCLAKDFQVYHALILIPFILLVFSFKGNEELPQDSFFSFYFGRQYFFTVALVFYAFISQPILTPLLSLSEHQDQATIASYIAKKTSKSDSVYSWDSNANIYLLSKRMTNNSFPVAVNYQTSQNTQSLEDGLLQNNEQYIVVNTTMTLSQTLKDNLSKNYKEVSVSGVTHYALYQKQ